MQPLLLQFLMLAQTVVVTGGTVHPLDGSAPYAGRVVVVDGVITSCGEDVAAPEDATVIDASGLHVVPGLIDGMIHHDGEHDDLYVRAGVVLARDLGNDMGRVLIARARRARADARGPRLFVCGSVLDGSPPITTKAVVVRSGEEARQKLSRLLELEVDFVTTHSGIGPEALRGAVEAAHGGGLQVWGPVPRGMSLEQTLGRGLDGIVGLDGFLSNRFGWVSAETPDLSSKVIVVRDSKVAVMPVLNAVAVRIVIPQDLEALLELMGPHYARQWQAEFEARERLGGPSYYERGALALSRQQDLLAELYGAGVPLVPGSGAPNPWVLPGDGLHRELEAWVQAGVPCEEVLRCATLGAAEQLGISDRLGSISRGKLGDILIIEGDPRESLAGLQRPKWVLLRGQVLSAEVLEQRVEELVKRQAEARRLASEEIQVEAPKLPEGNLVLSGRVISEVYGQQISVERYAVVERENGARSYCSRTTVPASAVEGASYIEFEQTVSGRLVESFDFVITSQGTRVEVRGRRIGSHLRVERRVDGQFLDNSSTSEAVGVVDPGSATASLVIAHHQSPGTFKALYFEDLEPAVVLWKMELKEGGIHALQTGEGPLVAIFRPDGGLDKMERTRGNSVLRQYSVETDTHGGAGLPLPPERLPAVKGEVEEGRDSPAEGDPEGD